MEPLPYFLLLLKKNVLLCSIIATGSFTQVDLSQVKHVAHTDVSVDFLNFSLSETEKFPTVNVMTIDSTVTLIFHTTNADYYDHPERYFEQGGVERVRQPFKIFGYESQTRDKYLGDFEFLGLSVPPASVYVRHSSLSGYTISVNFYSFNLPANKIDAK